MADRYWMYGSLPLNSSGSYWSSTPGGCGRCSIAGLSLTVVLSTGNGTGSMAVGMQVYTWTSTTARVSRGTVTSIVSSTQFTVSLAPGSATNLMCTWGNPSTTPTSADDVYIRNNSTTFAYNVTTTGAFACKSFTIGVTNTGTTGIITVTPSSSFYINVYGNVDLSGYINVSGSTNLWDLRGDGGTNTFSFAPTNVTTLYSIRLNSGNYVQQQAFTLTANFFLNGDGWTTQSHTLGCASFTATAQATPTKYFDIGTGIVNCNSTSTTVTPFNMSTPYTEGLTFYGTGFFVITQNIARTTFSQAFGGYASVNAANIRFTACSQIAVMSGRFDIIDLTNFTGSWTSGSNFPACRTLIGQVTGTMTNFAVTFWWGGGYYQRQGTLLTHEPQFVIIDHTYEIGTTQLYTDYSRGTRAETLTLTSGRLDLNGFIYYVSTHNFSGTTARGIDFNGGSLGGYQNTIFNYTDASNFTITGTPTVNLGVTTGTATLTCGNTARTDDSGWFDFYFGTSATAKGITPLGYFGILDMQSSNIVGGVSARTLYVKSLIGSSNGTAQSWITALTLNFYGDGQWARNALTQTAPQINFISGNNTSLPQGTTTLNSPLPATGALAISNQNIDWNSQSYTMTTNPIWIGNSYWTNLGTFNGSSVTSVNDGALEITSGTFNTPTVTLNTGGLALSGTVSANISTINIGNVGSAGVGNLFISVNVTIPTITFNLGYIYFYAGGYSLSCTNFTSSAASTDPINKYIYGAGTINCSGNWTADSTTPITFITAGAIVNMTSASAKNFYAGAGSYKRVNQAGAGAMTVLNNGTYVDFGSTVTPCTITFESGTTTTITNSFDVNGTSGNLITINSTTPTSQATLSKSSGAVTSVYLSLQDSNATGGAVWTANNSTFGSNVTGWLGNAVAYVKSRFMAFF